MKPLRIHIGALHRNRWPLLLSSKPSPTIFPTFFQTIEVNRRHLSGMAAVAGVGLPSAGKMVETVPASAGEVFETTFTKNRVAFSQNGNEHGNATKKGTQGFETFWGFLRQTDRILAYPATAGGSLNTEVRPCPTTVSM